MKNQETWDFAQIYSSKKMITYGFSMAICSLLGLLNLIPISLFYMFVSLSILLIVCILMIVEVEMELKKRFY
ncbi:SdpI family protein [uncultured Polaribacter sp.]|uniref:SdpI family protein n=1 Tax=uncultured Polaribacter sp. TaxID=174711 RepID=UPI002638D5FE|nr:SdpI family protein [uncultured Polaribacter sp.]